MQNFTESILQSIQQHSEFAWLIVFLIAFIESMAIIGLVMPGWVLLVGIGTMIGADVLEFWPVVISAYFGAVIGEYISFHVGYHYHEIILKWKYVARHQKMIERSKMFFEKHGAAGVFFGRFIGPVRAVMPLIAGISEMSKRTFFWVNLSSGLIWAPLYLIPGILVGATFQLEKEMSMSLLFIFSIIGLVLWMAVSQTQTLLKIIKGVLERNKTYAVINTMLSWILFSALIIMLTQSIYYQLVENILGVVWSKLF